MYGTIGANYGAEKVTSTTEDLGLAVGTRMVLADGRVFYYSFSQGAIGAGHLAMQVAGVSTHDMDLVTAAAALGATAITVTLEATNATTLDQYKDGFLYVNDNAGEGHCYKIFSNPVIAASAAGVITLYEGDGIAEALTSASLCGLMANPFNNVEDFDADDVDGPCLGVAPTEVADNAYFWLQTWGECAVLCDVASVLGEPVKVSDNADGATKPLNRDATDEDDMVVGVAALIATVTTDYGMIDLKIRP